MSTGSCIDAYLASAGGCAQKRPEEGHTLAPWVSIEFEGSGSVITVGNESSPNTSPQHVACIKSFEFGYSDGLSCRVTIQDQQGGSFEKFMENILKHYVCLKDGSPAAVRMKVQFGWCKSGCQTAFPTSKSPTFYCLCDSVETNFAQGKFTFEITGKDTCSRMFEGGAVREYGGLGEAGMFVTDAIRQFMTSGPSPNLGSVRFMKMEGGSPVPAEFKENGLRGPKGKWIAQGQDKLTCVRRWMDRCLSADGKGWIPQYNSLEPNGELIFWVDSKPRCKEEGDGFWNENCIGTYIVNGGKESPVIEFNPKIRWDFARMVTVGGNLGSERLNAQQTPGSVNPGRDCPTLDRSSDEGAGHVAQTTPTETMRDNHAGNATLESRIADDESMYTVKILTDNIEADLVVIGDPTMLPPSEAMWSKNVAIVLVNPFYIMFSGDRCGEWLAQPLCNPVLSNKAWLCKSITHRIELGNYTTTIGVYLVAPGVDIPANMALGAWTGGWKPPVTC